MEAAQRGYGLSNQQDGYKAFKQLKYKIMIDSRLIQADVIAIPIVQGSNPLHPNFFVIGSQFGKTRVPQMNFEGNIVETDCVRATYHLAQREILQANATRQEEYIERVVCPTEMLNIPVDVLPLLFSHERIAANIVPLNFLLSAFSFRGALEGFQLIIDENRLNQILQP